MFKRKSFIQELQKAKQILLIAVVMSALSACNLTKFVPQGEYLLNDVKVKVEDTKNVSTGDLLKFVQQKQNTEILGFWKLQLGIYNTASLDTTKWTSKNARRIGEAPVIFSSDKAESSCLHLQRAMQNKGYFAAEVPSTQSNSKANRKLLTF